MSPVPTRRASDLDEGPGSGNDHYLHAKNFVESIRGNETLNAPVETGYTAALYAHAGNVSYRSGDTLYWNEEGELENAEKYRSEEHTSELQSRGHLVCRLLLEKKKESNTVLIR